MFKNNGKVGLKQSLMDWLMQGIEVGFVGGSVTGGGTNPRTTGGAWPCQRCRLEKLGNSLCVTLGFVRSQTKRPPLPSGGAAVLEETGS